MNNWKFSLSSLPIVFTVLFLAGCGGGGSSQTAAVTPLCRDAREPGHVCSVLFVGDSFTHGRYQPVRTFNGQKPDDPWRPPMVIDENYGHTGERAESKREYGPWGGIPAIFAELAEQKHLNYEVHIEAISETSLEKNYRVASDVIARPDWNGVVLQELSVKPYPSSLTKNPHSDPPGFWASVQTIERAVHAVAPTSSIFLYETWTSAELARHLAGDPAAPDFHEKYLAALDELGDANLASYQCAARRDGKIGGVAPVGEAWRLAWRDGLANPDPFQSSSLPLLWYGIKAVNDPPIKEPDYHHPSIYGAYMSGLVLFVQMTGADVRTLGANEQAAAHLGIPGDLAAQMQQEAWLTVKHVRRAAANKHKNPCKLVEDGQ